MRTTEIPSLATLSKAFAQVQEQEPENARLALAAAAKAVLGYSPHDEVKSVSLRTDAVFIEMKNIGRDTRLDDQGARAALYGALLPFVATGQGLVIIADTAARGAVMAAQRLRE